jgi:hypothetical protein
MNKLLTYKANTQKYLYFQTLTMGAQMGVKKTVSFTIAVKGITFLIKETKYLCSKNYKIFL